MAAKGKPTVGMAVGFRYRHIHWHVGSDVMPLAEITWVATDPLFEVQASTDVTKTQGRVYPSSIQNARQNEQCLLTAL